ncbi:hypothetical protein [Rhizobium lentis]|uniref:Ead/Ea22-like family protein n=1 Tax=Rhizobium lentis TaxID=1138194 RepID=A0ABS7IH88_9HYPH|nr:hypothetical protein [Rhizobium lentis]MBX5089370.1 hypothetical protein [Rhizobium lentis]
MSERDDNTSPPSPLLMGTDTLLARVASIICEETCGLTSECKSREAAKALLDKGYLAIAQPEPSEKKLDLGITKEWFERRAKAEADLEIGAGFSVVNVTDADAAQMEVLAERALPEWAQSELARLRAIALDMQAAYVEANNRAETAVVAANALQVEVDQLRKALADMLPPDLPWRRDADGVLIHHKVAAINAARAALATATEGRGE